MNVGTITDPSTGETFANVNDLIALFKDIKEHPEKYNEDAVVTLIGQLAGRWCLSYCYNSRTKEPILKTKVKTKSNFLKLEEIPIGSWWSIAQGGKYGYCVISKNTQTQDVTVLSTLGETRTIDYFTLQYRYKQVIPDETKYKYLHIEIIDGSLYVYADSTAWKKSKEVTLNELDHQCDLGSARGNKHIRIPLKDFLK